MLYICQHNEKRDPEKGMAFWINIQNAESGKKIIVEADFEGLFLALILVPSLLSVWYWASCLTSLCLRFLICKTGIRFVPIATGSCKAEGSWIRNLAEGASSKYWPSLLWLKFNLAKGSPLINSSISCKTHVSQSSPLSGYTRHTSCYLLDWIESRVLPSLEGNHCSLKMIRKCI